MKVWKYAWKAVDALFAGAIFLDEWRQRRRKKKRLILEMQDEPQTARSRAPTVVIRRPPP